MAQEACLLFFARRFGDHRDELDAVLSSVPAIEVMSRSPRAQALGLEAQNALGSQVLDHSVCSTSAERFVTTLGDL